MRAAVQTSRRVVLIYCTMRLRRDNRCNLWPSRFIASGSSCIKVITFRKCPLFDPFLCDDGSLPLPTLRLTAVVRGDFPLQARLVAGE